MKKIVKVTSVKLVVSPELPNYIDDPNERIPATGENRMASFLKQWATEHLPRSCTFSIDIERTEECSACHERFEIMDDPDHPGIRCCANCCEVLSSI